MESIKCHSFELNRLDVHFILSVEKNIFFVCVCGCFKFVPRSLSRCSFSETGYLIYVRVVMCIT